MALQCLSSTSADVGLKDLSLLAQTSTQSFAQPNLAITHDLAQPSAEPVPSNPSIEYEDIVGSMPLTQAALKKRKLNPSVSGSEPLVSLTPFVLDDNGRNVDNELVAPSLAFLQQ